MKNMLNTVDFNDDITDYYTKKVDQRRANFIRAVSEGDINTVREIISFEHKYLCDFLNRSFKNYIQTFKFDKRSIVHAIDPMVCIHNCTIVLIEPISHLIQKVPKSYDVCLYIIVVVIKRTFIGRHIRFHSAERHSTLQPQKETWISCHT